MEEMLAGMIRTSTPILLAALGGVLCEKSGVFTIAHEGMMLVGAFFGILAVYYTKNVWSSIPVALICGGIIGLLYVFLVERMKANGTIASIGINTLAIGVTTYMMKMIFGNLGTSASGIVGFDKIEIQFVEKIPYLGKLLSGHTVLVYFSIILVFLMQFFLYRTNIGVNLRAVGEKPEAAAAAGIHVMRYRVLACMACGMLCGLAGTHLSLGYVTLFTEDMIGGRGFFAYTAVVFGSANPLSVWVASLIFGLAEIVSYRAQSTNFPSPIVLMLPYVTTVIALIVRSIRLQRMENGLVTADKKRLFGWMEGKRNHG